MWASSAIPSSSAARANDVRWFTCHKTCIQICLQLGGSWHRHRLCCADDEGHDLWRAKVTPTLHFVWHHLAQPSGCRKSKQGITDVIRQTQTWPRAFWVASTRRSWRQPRWAGKGRRRSDVTGVLHNHSRASTMPTNAHKLIQQPRFSSTRSNTTRFLLWSKEMKIGDVSSRLWSKSSQPTMKPHNWYCISIPAQVCGPQKYRTFRSKLQRFASSLTS